MTDSAKMLHETLVEGKIMDIGVIIEAGLGHSCGPLGYMNSPAHLDDVFNFT